MKSRHKDAKKASSQHKVTSLLIENWILASQVIWKIHYSHNHIMTLAIGKVTIIGLIISQTVSNDWYALTPDVRTAPTIAPTQTLGPQQTLTNHTPLCCRC